jgi:energy-coupling factor transporter transmembrane protein EcfT
MLARGFTGQVRTLTDYRMRAADWALAAGSILLAAAVIYANGWRV